MRLKDIANDIEWGITFIKSLREPILMQINNEKPIDVKTKDMWYISAKLTNRTNKDIDNIHFEINGKRITRNITLPKNDCIEDHIFKCMYIPCKALNNTLFWTLDGEPVEVDNDSDELIISMIISKKRFDKCINIKEMMNLA